MAYSPQCGAKNYLGEIFQIGHDFLKLNASCFVPKLVNPATASFELLEAYFCWVCSLHHFQLRFCLYWPFFLSQLRTEMASTSQTNYILWAVLSEPGSTLRISDGEKERDMNYSAATRDDWTDYRSIKSTLFSHHYV